MADQGEIGRVRFDAPHLEVNLIDNDTLQIRMDACDDTIQPAVESVETNSENLKLTDEPYTKVYKTVVMKKHSGSQSAKVTTKEARIMSTSRKNCNKNRSSGRLKNKYHREISSASINKRNTVEFTEVSPISQKSEHLESIKPKTTPRVAIRSKLVTVSGNDSSEVRRASVAPPSGGRRMTRTDVNPVDDVLGLTIQQVKAFKEVFELFDRNGGGTIDAEGLDVNLRSLGIELSQEEIDEVLRTLDRDESGDIDFKEFLTLMTSTERFIEMLTQSHNVKDKEETKPKQQNYHHLLFEMLTGLMKDCAQKNKHAIVGYYQKKYNSSKVAHQTMNHYAAGERLIGLTEKQLKIHLENLRKATSRKGSKNLSPYAQPLHIVMSTTNLRGKKQQKQQQQKKTGRISLKVKVRYTDNSTNNDKPKPAQNKRINNIRDRGGLKRYHACPEEATHDVGWVSQRTEHIEVKLPPYYLKSLLPFDELTAEDLPWIRSQVNSAIREYCLQRRHTQVQDGIQHWHSLEPGFISPKTLRNNFRAVFSTYTDIDVKYLPLSTTNTC